MHLSVQKMYVFVHSRPIHVISHIYNYTDTITVRILRAGPTMGQASALL